MINLKDPNLDLSNIWVVHSDGEVEKTENAHMDKLHYYFLIYIRPKFNMEQHATAEQCYSSKVEALKAAIFELNDKIYSLERELDVELLGE
jgi:hypothetical protein